MADPDNSAMLHVNSVTKGFLLPRITSGTPASPATGLLFYNSSTNEVFVYSGAWEIVQSSTIGAGAGGVGTAAGILIGTGTIDASAKMEIRTTSSKGLLIPRLTSVERDLIKSPAEGLTIYNTTDNKIQYYAAATWYNWAVGTSDYGMVVGNPGQSCKDIIDNNLASAGVDGTYWIDPDGAGAGAAYQCYCDNTRDGGGWTLVENTGPKKQNNRVSGSSGATPILPTQTTFAKLTDADINLVRGAYASSALKVERQNSCQSNKSIYFKQNRILNSTSVNNTQSIRTYHTTYADAVSGANLQTGTTNYGSAFDCWTGGTTGYQIIFDYGSEGFITNGCYSTSVCTANNRSECRVLLWIKQLL